MSSPRNKEPSVVAEATLAASLYQSIRAELCERLILRDRALAFFLTAAAAIGAFFGTIGQINEEWFVSSYILLLGPILAYASASIVASHHSIIGYIEIFLSQEFTEYLEEAGFRALPWENSRSFLETTKSAIGKRSTSHFHVLLIPSGIFVLSYLGISIISIIDVSPCFGTMLICVEHTLSNLANPSSSSDESMNIEMFFRFIGLMFGSYYLFRCGSVLKQSDSERKKLAETIETTSKGKILAETIETTEAH